MPKKLVWTEAQDETIKRLRADGQTWDEIATFMQLSRWTVIERGRRLGARPPATEDHCYQDPNREPLPPGHPTTWDPLVRGSCLEGVPYRDFFELNR
jgi:hypothetical protein